LGLSYETVPDYATYIITCVMPFTPGLSMHGRDIRLLPLLSNSQDEQSAFAIVTVFGDTPAPNRLALSLSRFGVAQQIFSEKGEEHARSLSSCL
jgi:hypothetical protein